MLQEAITAHPDQMKGVHTLVDRALGRAVLGLGFGERMDGYRAQARRTAEERRPYVGDPWAYLSDVLGWSLTPQQEEALALMEEADRVLVPAANNVGKTFLLAGYGVYRLDSVASVPDDSRSLEEQGGHILLPGPDHDTVFATIYAEMLAHAARAEARGYIMPGVRSDRSVLWRVRPKWHVEAFSPPKRAGQRVTHTASGRHHRNQVALIEEGQGVDEALWLATEGMCSGSGNKVISSFNPTESVGPAYQRSRGETYRTLHLSAFDHPNVIQRTLVVEDAVDFRVIDQRVRSDARDRGPANEVKPDPAHHDFAYALPPLGADEAGPREDAVPGHPDGEVHVYRPGPTFNAQVLGQWAEGTPGGLFDVPTWDQAVARWKEGTDPETDPDRVGVDPARDGRDDACSVPSWGEDAETLLRAFADLEAGNGDLDTLRETRRVRAGRPWIMPGGDGQEVARSLVDRYGYVPFNVDIGGVGTSPVDFLRREYEADVAAVSFAAVAPDPIREGFEPWCDNLRTSMYVRAARLVLLGLADVPDDPLLREEVMAHELLDRSRVVEVEVSRNGSARREKKRMPSVLLIGKDVIKKRIGRSPDRSDGWVLSLYGPVLPKPVASAAPIGLGRSSPYRNL